MTAFKSLPLGRLAAAAAALTLLGNAAGSAWHFNFQQGTAEYAVGSFAPGRSNLALYCAEGLRPGRASVSLHRAGYAAPAGTPATFITERGRVTLTLDGDGSIDFASNTAPPYRALWRLLAGSRTLTVRYGPGRPIGFPLRGAAGMLGHGVCPRQLAS